jgi:8-oxo-(d)GTP phosphatase
MPDGRLRASIPAAGAVAWRLGGTGRQGASELLVALVHRPKYDDWSFPKGKREPGEHVLRTAVREVAEEAGLRIVLGRRLPESVYPVDAGVKHVSYWAARSVGQRVIAAVDEVDEVAWLPVTAARERLSYPRDRLLLDAFASGPARTVPLIVLRHASAGAKAASDAENLARPLDARGAADAHTLASLLPYYGRCQVISSAAERCLATVRPYAEAVGSRIELAEALTMPANGQAASGAADLASHLARSGEPALICAHRENLQPLINGAFRALGVPGPQPPALGKGEFLVLQHAGGALASAERHDATGLAQGGLAVASRT